ncbi:hypothetical protein H5410_040536 [Solanum commersonii]|uniref:Uncharacterized protein n=1 Tax=Solanum commersonii TaxID=4109 RepID=A0A9J5XST1_SOLCO|nr:hypothetical protein H5410_040536 [Solanum commersonii]
MQRSLSQKRTPCMFSPIGLPVFSNQHLFQFTQDQKGLFKASNGVECKDLTYGASWSPRPKRPINKVKRAPEQSMTFYGYSEFRCHFCQKLTWTSIKTLAMESIGCHDQNGQFTRSSEPQSSPRHFIVTQNSDVIFAKNLHGPLLRP